MPSNILKIAILLTFSLISGGCNPNITENASIDNNKPNVVATSTLIADWTENIAGENINLVSLLKPGDDPHIYEPVPQDSVALEQANLILYNGYNLEPNLIKMMNSVGNKAQKVAVGEIIDPLSLTYEGRTVPDPHVWGNVQNVIKMVKLINQRLSELYPENKAKFAENTDKFIKDLEKLDQWIKEQIATIPPDKRKLVTTHDAFQYYTQAYGLEVAGTLIGISTEEQPSAKTVQTLAESIKKLGIPAIFAETTLNPRLITIVAEEAGVKLAPTPLYSDSLGAENTSGDTYIKMMVTNTRAIVDNLGGKSTPFPE